MVTTVTMMIVAAVDKRVGSPRKAKPEPQRLSVRLCQKKPKKKEVRAKFDAIN